VLESGALRGCLDDFSLDTKETRGEAGFEFRSLTNVKVDGTGRKTGHSSDRGAAEVFASPVFLGASARRERTLGGTDDTLKGSSAGLPEFEDCIDAVLGGTPAPFVAGVWFVPWNASRSSKEWLHYGCIISICC